MPKHYEFYANDLPKINGVRFLECETEAEAIAFCRFAERSGKYETMRWFDPEINKWVARVCNW